MRFIKTTNGQVEFSEVNNDGQIVSTRGFNLGSMYYLIKNGKVTFYANDSETPYRSDLWSVDLPVTIDNVEYNTPEAVAEALGNVMNGVTEEKIEELEEEIGFEEVRARTEEARIEQKVDNEVTRATQRETTIVGKLNEEIQRAKDAEQANTTAITAETANRINGDNVLGERITTNANVISAEITRASGAENELNSKINSVSGTVNDAVSDLEAETANRISGDSQLSTAIQNEAQRAVSAETANANAITAETLNRTTADNALQTQITANANAIATKADKANAVASAEYIESNHLISFKNVNGAVISYIDASAFVVDGMVNDAYVRGDKLIITFNTDAGKQNIEIPLSDIFNPDNYYTKAQINDRYYTKSECDSKYVTEEYVSGLTDNFYTKDEINSIEAVQNSKIDAVSGDIQTLNDEIQTISGESMTSGEVETMIDEAVSGKADTSAVTEAITAAVSGKADTSAVTEAITAAVSGKADADSVYSKTESDNKYQTKGDYVTGAQMSAYTYDKQTIDDKIAQGGTFDPTQYYNKTQTNELLADKANTATTYTKTEVDSALAGKADTATTYTKSEVDSALANKADTATTYTKSEVDSALAGKANTATTEALNTALTSHTSSSDIHVTVSDKNVWNGKQNQLTAGTGISIVNDVISVTASSPTVDAYTKAESDAKFATITNFNTHSGDTNVHVTSTEKNTWNNKSDFSGSYNDLTNKPTIPTIWTGTQAEFDAITVKDPNTLYLVR